MNKKRIELLKSITRELTRTSRKLDMGNCFTVANCQLTRTKAEILFFIASRPGGVAVKEIAAEFQVTSGAVTQFVDSLVESGLVVRTEGTQDRRTQLLSLTDVAKKEFARFDDDFVAQIQVLFQNLSDQELVSLSSMLVKISDTNIQLACKTGDGGDVK